MWQSYEYNKLEIGDRNITFYFIFEKIIIMYQNE
jgi:hypothetical protein